MKTVAFVTCSTKPDIAPDDRQAAALLRQHGIEVSAAPWDLPNAHWSDYDLVVLRSCWNYHLHPEAFNLWLDQREADRTQLWNPANIVRWNLHKGYLRELQDQGATLPATLWKRRGESVSLVDLLEQTSWQRLVIKPAISATAYKTLLVDNQNAVERQAEVDSLLQNRDILVQQFRPEVQTAGEWSLLFFDKKYSHSIIKKPKSNDFRVQDDFGGTAEEAIPPSFAIAEATSILQRVNEPLLYTRVDGLVADGKFLLMELELIEPMLFLNHQPQAVDQFVRAIQNRLS